MEAQDSAKAGLAAWILPVLLGVGGSIGAVAALGSGTYDVAPFKVAMDVSFGASGQTRLAVQAPGVASPGVARADTHSGPLRFAGTIVDIDAAKLATSTVDNVVAGRSQDQPLDPTNPQSLALYLAQNGKDAARSFGIKVGALAAAGGLIGGLAGALGKPKKTIAGLIAGVAVIGMFGLIAQQSYDTTAFEGTRFESAQ